MSEKKNITRGIELSNVEQQKLVAAAQNISKVLNSVYQSLAASNIFDTIKSVNKTYSNTRGSMLKVMSKIDFEYLAYKIAIEKGTTQFHKDLRKENDYLAQYLLNSYYYTTCSSIEAIEYYTQRDKELQHKGVDKILNIDGKEIYIDEKIILNKRKYNKLLLELHRKGNIQHKGWMMDKNNITDFLMYYHDFDKQLYILHYKELQWLIEQHQDEWIKRYGYTYYGSNYVNINMPIYLLKRMMVNFKQISLVEYLPQAM